MFGAEQVLFGRDSYVDSPFDRESFKESLINKAEQFYDMDVLTIARKFGVAAVSKDAVRRVADAVLAADKGTLVRAGVYPKIYVLYPNSPATAQHMSLPAFHMKDVLYTDWWHSGLRKLVMDNDFLFMVFENLEQKPKRRMDKNIIFNTAFYWKMPHEDVEEMYAVYEEARKVIQQGIELYPVMGEAGKLIKGNNLPGPGYNRVCHIRPHGDPKAPEWLDNKRCMNQQSFWLNADYVQRIIASKRNDRLFGNAG